MRFTVVAVAGAALMLSGCQTDSAGGGSNAPVSSAAIRSVAPDGFRCPNAGTIVRLSSGGRFHHRGADPADPSVCVITSANGTQFRRLFDLVSLPNSNEANYRRSLATLWPLEVGKATEFTTIGQTRGGSTFQYKETWKVLRREPLQVGRTTRQAVVLEQTSEGIVGNSSMVAY